MRSDIRRADVAMVERAFAQASAEHEDWTDWAAQITLPEVKMHASL